jgi:hypothetical protein
MSGEGLNAVMPDGTPVRLAQGAHSSPDEGVCVVELASVIAKEKFSDRPNCVCPLIGAFLRGWNDRASHAERQRLGPYASRIVGSRGDRQVTRERRDICLAWTGADLTHGAPRRLLARTGMRIRIAVFCGIGAALRPNEGVGDYTSRVVLARDDAERAFELLETLLAVGEERRTGRPAGGNGKGPAHANGNGHARASLPGLPATEPDGPPPVNGNGSSVNGAPARVRKPLGSA